jgi:hypothetical protein
MHAFCVFFGTNRFVEGASNPRCARVVLGSNVGSAWSCFVMSCFQLHVLFLCAVVAAVQQLVTGVLLELEPITCCTHASASSHYGAVAPDAVASEVTAAKQQHVPQARMLLDRAERTSKPCTLCCWVLLLP